jgi:hypothetical protein
MMSNMTTVTTGGIGVATGGTTGVISTTAWPVITTGAPGSLTSGSILNGANFSTPKDFKAGAITIKATADTEEAEFDAAFINDLKLLLEVINEVPDEHPLGELKHDMRNRRAFKRLGG